MKRLAAFALLVSGCSAPPPEVALDVRVPSDTHHLLASLDHLVMKATRGSSVLSVATMPASTTAVALGGIPDGDNTVVELDGETAAGQIVGSGRTCPFHFGLGARASLYFAPTDFFAPTVGAPDVARTDPIAVTLGDGSVLLASGTDASGPLASAERYFPSSATFAAAPSQSLNLARWKAAVAFVPGVGALVTGGLDVHNAPMSTAEVFQLASQTFAPLVSDELGARVEHTAVTLPDGRVLLAGGRAGDGSVLATSALATLTADGGATVSAGPTLVEARRAHAAAVMPDGTAVLVGGYGQDGNPLASIEVFDSADGKAPHFQRAGALVHARAEATVTDLGDGSILVVGGAGDATGTPRADAELFHFDTGESTVYMLGQARRGHTATRVGDRVLVAGGVDASGQPLDSAELFIKDVGFVSERPMVAPRAGHVAIPLCDGTVLLVGGGAGAELYQPAQP